MDIMVKVTLLLTLHNQEIVLQLPDSYLCGDWGLGMRLNHSRLRDGSASAIVLIALLQAYI